AARSAVAAPTSAPPQIDGVPDEAVWQQAAPLDGFVQKEPFEGRPASEPTTVRILYDAEALYIAAWMHDRVPAGIVLGETRRDADLGDTDALLIILDTYLDRQNGFVFGTTPAGIEYDGQVTREGQGGFGGRMRQQAGSGGGFNKNWDGVWDVATSRDSAGWYAEFRIPFSTLRYAGGGPQQWGLNISRNIRRHNEQSFWAPVPRQYDIYRVSLAGTLTDFEAPIRRNIAVTPYVLGATRRDYVTSVGRDDDVQLGGDAKISLTPSLAFDLTVNTDFAQVEVDDEQINLTRFRLFFPEKRPFFLENAGTFAVGTPQDVELFFSRRIGLHEGRAVPILGGGRLTGKLAGATIGVLDVATDELTLADPATGQAVRAAPGNNFAVVRALRELPNRSRIGGIVVSRVSLADADDHNLTYGLDGRLGIGDALSFDAYAAGTETPAIAAPQYALAMSGSYNGRDWQFGGAGRQVSAGFNPEVGFLARDDYRFFSARVLRRIRFADLSWFREMRPHISYNEYRGLDGFRETGFLHIDSHFEFANGAFFQLPAINYNFEGLREPFEIADGVIVPAGEYGGWEWGFAYNTDLSAPLSTQGRIDIGSFYSGRRAGGSGTLNGRIGETFVAALRYTWYDVDLPQGQFTTALLGLRAAYSFTPRIYLQSLIQYNDQTETLSSNIRFGWLSDAGTGLFLVYNDIEQAALFERNAAPRNPLERAFIIKYTRLFDLSF
ncbi:MAG: DUF5916 domain-containing protein, partial [Longimicrobiales bacterium]